MVRLESCRARVLVALCLVVVLGGCAGYAARGRVVEGDFDFIAVVPENDPRLAGRGIGNARISFTRDPESLGREQVATGLSDPNGDFSVRLDAFGAGWMSEQWLVRAVRSRFGAAEGMLALPGAGSGERLLIVMRRGSAREVEDVEEQWERADDDFMGEVDRWRTP